MTAFPLYREHAATHKSSLVVLWAWLHTIAIKANTNIRLIFLLLVELDNAIQRIRKKCMHTLLPENIKNY